MIETRRTEIIDEEIEDFDEELAQEQESPETIRDELFENIKNTLLEEDPIRLIKKFHYYADQYTEFDYDDMGMDFEESDEVLKRCNILKEKIIQNLENTLQLQFTDTTIDTLHMMIFSNTSFKEMNFKIIIEVFEDSFDLEITAI